MPPSALNSYKSRVQVSAKHDGHRIRVRGKNKMILTLWGALHRNDLPGFHSFLCLSSLTPVCMHWILQDSPADTADADSDDARAGGHGPRPASPLFLPPLDHLASQHISEDDGACKLPPQHRIASHVMSHWAQHKAIEDKAPSSRCATFKPCIGCRLLMPFHAQRRASPATPSSQRASLPLPLHPSIGCARPGGA